MGDNFNEESALQNQHIHYMKAETVSQMSKL